MKVTVMSPVTSDVTIAQATAWLERNGWVRGDPHGDIVPWSKDYNSLAFVMPDDERSILAPKFVAAMIEEIARAVGETPAYVLEEMGWVIP